MRILSRHEWHYDKALCFGVMTLLTAAAVFAVWMAGSLICRCRVLDFFFGR